MISLDDQLGRKVELKTAAQRIISIVPSQTELLHYFGLEDETVGITKFCIHPKEWFENKSRVGGTKNVDLDKVRALHPDLIIANKEENSEADIEALSSEFPVYISDVNNLEEACQMIKAVGLLCGKQQPAVDLIDDIQDDFKSFPTYSGSVMYFIWREPYMVCGRDNFIHSIIERLGFENVISDTRYLELDAAKIKQLNPDYIFLSTEPFPFKAEHVEELRLHCSAEIKIVDGKMFSWYGSRMLKMKKYFQDLL